ncbi:MAG: acyltransferase family protein [Rhodospirillales bacterium]
MDCCPHFAEQIFRGWDIANPSTPWPPLGEGASPNWRRSAVHGIWDIPAWLLVNFALAGDQGVALFIILSGFGLTWSLSKKPAGWGGFLRRRLARIYPEYWMAHLFVLAGSLVFKEPLQSGPPSCSACWASASPPTCSTLSRRRGGTSV